MKISLHTSSQLLRTEMTTERNFSMYNVWTLYILTCIWCTDLEQAVITLLYSHLPSRFKTIITWIITPMATSQTACSTVHSMDLTSQTTLFQMDHFSYPSRGRVSLIPMPMMTLCRWQLRGTNSEGQGISEAWWRLSWVKRWDDMNSLYVPLFICFTDFLVLLFRSFYWD